MNDNSTVGDKLIALRLPYNLWLRAKDQLDDTGAMNSYIVEAVQAKVEQDGKGK